MSEPMVDRPCLYGGLGLTGDLTGLPGGRVFGARCSCGAHVTIVDGRIPFHREGLDERPPDEACEPGPTDEKASNHGNDS